MSQLVDFLFTGVAVLPGALLFGGRPDLAMMLFWPLLIAACITAVWVGDYAAGDQARRSPRGSQGGAARTSELPDSERRQRRE